MRLLRHRRPPRSAALLLALTLVLAACSGSASTSDVAARVGDVEITFGSERILARELDDLELAWPSDLPAGVIHADLFPDNVFFEGAELSGIIDFYFACNDLIAYDLAVCLNAWCFEPDGAFNITKARQMLAAYRAVRPFTGAELRALPLLARGAVPQVTCRPLTVRIDLKNPFIFADTTCWKPVFNQPPEEQKRISDRGDQMRVYIPYGEDWYGYLMRRMAEKPANVMFFLRGLATRG